MSAPATPYRIARLWALAFAADRPLIAWVNDNYGKPFHVQIGADMRRPPAEEDAPYIAIFPDAGTSGPQRQNRDCELGLVAGIADAEWLDDPAGFRELRALARLNHLVPLLENAMRMALPDARLHEVETQYDILQYPLCQAVMTVTVQESLPIGRRL